MPLDFERWKFIRDLLIMNITAAAATWPVDEPIALVTNVAISEEDVYPYIGVEFDFFDEALEGMGIHQLTYWFWIGVGVQAQFDPAHPDTAATALGLLDQYTGDDAGHGLSPLLSTIGTDAGGLAVQEAMITNYMQRPRQQAASAASAVAVGVYRFKVVDTVRRFST